MHYLVDMKTSTDLRGRIVAHLNYVESRHRYNSFNDDDRMFKLLSDKLRNRLRVEIFRPILRRSPTLRELPENLVHSIASEIQSHVTAPSEAVITVGTFGRVLYVVLMGTVSVLGADAKVLYEVADKDMDSILATVAMLNNSVMDSLMPSLATKTARRLRRSDDVVFVVVVVGKKNERKRRTRKEAASGRERERKR